MSGSPLPRLGAVSAGCMLALVTGCADSDSSGPLGPDDLASYGCALVADLDEGSPAGDWNLGGDMAADGEYANAIVAIGVLGGLSGTSLDGYENLHRPTVALTTGLEQRDVDSIEAGMDDLASACAATDLPSGDADTSIEGRISWACTLDSEIYDADVFTEDWSQQGATVSNADRLVLTKAYSVGALLGGAAPAELDDHPELFEAAGSLLYGLGRHDADRTVDELETIHRLCDEL